MIPRISNFLNKSYPQNYIIRRPFIGTLIFLAFCFCFVVLYKPLDLHQARLFNFEFTMAIYLGSLSIPLYFIVLLLKRIKYFSRPNEWTFSKEIVSIVLILFGMGIVIYFIGFMMEVPAKRWNLATFLDSCEHAFLVGIVPLGFSTVMNYRHLFAQEIVTDFTPDLKVTPVEQPEKIIRISSQLKKEELNIYPSQIVYAESDSNYVVFYLEVDKKIQKKIIRNSISNIEQQLSAVPFLMRTHRAYIVNLKQIVSQKGNSLGYRLTLHGIDATIPVSRQKSSDFDQLMTKYR